MPFTSSIGGAVIAAGATAYGVHEQNKAAEAAESVKPPVAPQQPLTAAQSSAAQAQQANLLAQSAGGTLLSSPTQSGSRQVGTGNQPPATKLGTS